jgi:CheY-like chemotaxis protein
MASGQQRRHILVIDDHSIVRDMLADCLQDEGYDVSTAATGQEALDQLRSGPLPALILLDWYMPVIGGREFLLRQQGEPGLAKIPVVVVSCDEILAQDVGAAASIRKPFDLKELLATVAALCGTLV